MSAIFGLLNLSDTDRSFVSTIGQSVVYDAVQEQMRMHNEEIRRVTQAFISGMTEDFKWRYKLPGNKMLPKVGDAALLESIKAYGEWDVAFPLEGHGAQLAGSRVELAYMSVQELDMHLNAIMEANIRRIRWEILHRLLDNVATTWTDPIHGSLTVQPLANGDSVTYPPVAGSATEATEDHYLASEYTSGNISEDNNPLITMKNDLMQHFGGSVQGGSNVAVFGGQTDMDNIESGLSTSFKALSDRFIQEGMDTAQPVNVPVVPGIIRGRANGVWCVEWRWMPDDYLLAVSLDEDAPLVQRVDPADTGLPRGLALVATQEYAPLQGAHYVNRFGVGAGNRLNGVVMYLDSGSSYSIPSDYD
jgi:hypothetical protein